DPVRSVQPAAARARPRRSRPQGVGAGRRLHAPAGRLRRDREAHQDRLGGHPGRRRAARRDERHGAVRPDRDGGGHRLPGRRASRRARGAARRPLGL
ncbi:MAG: hypothetical protein AVDCRST_MAG07-2900, partial [uncultured Frankineae bacterium]